jgi:hypothetical protein
VRGFALSDGEAQRLLGRVRVDRAHLRRQAHDAPGCGGSLAGHR